MHFEMSNKITGGKLRGDRKDKKRRTPEGPPWLCAALEIVTSSTRKICRFSVNFLLVHHNDIRRPAGTMANSAKLSSANNI